MAIKRCESSIDVVKAAKIRIRNVFGNGLPVYMSFSGGKDSLCMAQLVMELVQAGEINPAQLTVQFIDEEAIFPCMEDKVKEWRKKFMLIGARFEWYCLEVKHYNCFNELSNDETFICWDRYKKDVWVRQPPSFAIRSHPLLKPRIDAYQDFLPRVCSDGVTITGIRTAESVQRLQNIATMLRAGKTMTNKHQVFPIYDWTNNDVWLYLLREKVDIPEIYLFLWQSGTRKGQLRVSQFFSIDTAKSLVKMNEYYPDLMERIVRREPNAYLAALYWDSEMFGRSTTARKQNEKGAVEKDYKAALLELFSDVNRNFQTKHKRYVAERYRNFFMSVSAIADNKDCKAIYEGLVSGDPKLRSYRALYQRIYGKYITEAKKKEGMTNGYNSWETVTTQKYETIVQLVVKSTIETKNLKYTMPKEVLYEGSKDMIVTIEEPINRYYVYGKDGVMGTFSHPANAINLAYSLSGTVVNEKGGYIWKKTGRSIRNQIMAITGTQIDEDTSQLAVCLETILGYAGSARNVQALLDKGMTATQILAEGISDARILELSGVSLDAILYYVNQDIPVLASLNDNSAVLVIGFNEQNIVVMDPKTGTIYKKGMNDSAQWFEENGNQFVTYVYEK